MSSQSTLDSIPDWKRIAHGVPAETRQAHQPTSHGQRQDTPDHPKPREECQSCGHHLPLRVRRVYGDQQDIVWECMHCPHTNREGLLETADTAGVGRQVRECRAENAGGHGR